VPFWALDVTPCAAIRLAGVELVSVSANQQTDLRNIQTQGGAESGAVGARNPAPAGPESSPGLIDPDLAEVVARWPALPEATRQSIVGMVRAAGAV